MTNLAEGKTYKYAARLNSFKNARNSEDEALFKLPAVLGLLSRAATMHGLNAVDLNFPDHLDEVDLKQHRIQSKRTAQLRAHARHWNHPFGHPRNGPEKRGRHH